MLLLLQLAVEVSFSVLSHDAITKILPLFLLYVSYYTPWRVNGGHAELRAISVTTTCRIEVLGDITLHPLDIKEYIKENAVLSTHSLFMVTVATTEAEPRLHMQ